MSTSQDESDEDDNHFETLSSLEKLKYLRRDVNWEDEEEREEFVSGLFCLITDWEGQLPNLRDIFQKEEIDWLLEAPMDCRFWYLGNNFIRFAVKTGYKDEPVFDKNGKPLLRRTTAVHRAVHKNFLLSSDIFEIYNRFDLNYTDESGLTHFHAACTFSFCDESIKKFLEARHDPNHLYQKTGESPLHFAMKHKNIETVKLLLEGGANPNLANKNGLNPLHVVCMHDHDSYYLLDSIIKYSRDQYRPVQVNARTNLGNTPLHLALENGHENLVLLLLRNGADPNEANNEGSTPVHIVCQNIYNKSKYNYIGSALKLFYTRRDEHQSVQVNARDKLGNAPLHLALKNGHRELVRLLLENGVDPYEANNEGSTPLHIICQKKSNTSKYYDLHLAWSLFEISSDENQSVQLNAQDKLGNAPLHLALKNGLKNLIRFLLENDANPNVANNEGSTPLHIICQNKYNYINLAKMLFYMSRQPVQLNARDKLGNAPLHLALKNGHKKLVRWLLRNGAHPNVANNEGSTPLHIISERDTALFGDIEDLVKLFFKIADKRHLTVQIDTRDELGRTPLQLAVVNLSPDVVSALLEKGANFSSFIFPKKFSYDERFERRGYQISEIAQLRLVSGALAVLVSLQENGYEPTLDDALKIMDFFNDHIGFSNSTDLEVRWDDYVEFTNEAKENRLLPFLSLYHLLHLRPEEADKWLTPIEYFKLLSSEILPFASHSVESGLCFKHFRESIARRFFRIWAVYSFMKLLNYQLPPECCEMVIDESITNKVLYDICLAYKMRQNSSCE